MRNVLVVTAIGLMAASEAVPLDFLDPTSKMFVVSVLAFLVIWLVTRSLPAKDALFTDALDKLTSAINDLREHCAAAREE